MATIECLQKVSEDPIKICPECNQPSLQKLISAAGFRLKGGGWYETDFKGKQDKKKNLLGDGEPASNSSATTTSQEPSNNNTKTENKADSKADANSKADAKKADTKSDSKTESKT